MSNLLEWSKLFYTLIFYQKNKILNYDNNNLLLVKSTSTQSNLIRAWQISSECNMVNILFYI